MFIFLIIFIVDIYCHLLGKVFSPPPMKIDVSTTLMKPFNLKQVSRTFVQLLNSSNMNSCQSFTQHFLLDQGTPTSRFGIH